MAKKKKKTTKKSKKSDADYSQFWRQSAAVLLIVLAFFMVIGGFGQGGSLPSGLFSATYWTLGWAAWLAPLALVYFAWHKFQHEESIVPVDKLIGMMAVVVSVASWLHVTLQIGDRDHGGSIGSFLGSATLNALTAVPASILFFAIALLAFFYAFGISPKVLYELYERQKEKKAERNEAQITDVKELKENAKSKGMQLNESVPVENGADKVKKRLSTFRNTADTPDGNEGHAALTTSKDPDWQYPGLDLLDNQQGKADPGDVEGNAEIIKDTFANFNINVEMESANIGPRVTQYALKPPSGVKLAKMVALENNLALDLAAQSIRMEAPIPGKRLVGVEVPNVKSATVRVASLLQTKDWQKINSPLGFVLGQDIAGNPMVGDLAKMPHLLIAGQTGSGKSVMINTFLTSLLYRNSPSDLRMVLVDPKQVELTPYNDIPHLLAPVINEPEKCVSALKWAVAEMERRLKTMASVGRRNIVEFNKLKDQENMPYVVIVIDELADLMMMAARDVEALIVRIAQKARAAGIHLVLATQRPSVNVITGLIKANVPARIAFTTTSQVDSRTVIDQSGAEKLLGQGDMLFTTSNMPKPVRAQAAFISDEETQKVTDFIRMQRPPEYDDEIITQPVQFDSKGSVVADLTSEDDGDDMFDDAVRAVIDAGKASTSMLQRRLRVGYGRAARLIEHMEERGIVGPADGSRPRDVLVGSYDEAMGGPKTSDDVLDENFSNQPDDEMFS